jgi:multidrug efflux pump subunit AcrB
VKETQDRKGLLGWFATNHVAANLLMFLIIIGGFLTIFSTKLEIFPHMSLDMITITIPYLGAPPADVEQGVNIRVEEAIAGIEGIKRITSYASEGAGTIVVEISEYADAPTVLDDIKAQVGQIITFPEETEKPIISEIKTIDPVITVVVYGDVSEKVLRVLASGIRDDLTSMQIISQVGIAGVRPYEISIEVSENTLRRYGLSFDQVAQVVRESSLDIPGGTVKTEGGEILVRTKGQKYYGPEFEKIVVVAREDGTEIQLRDIAEVKDDFVDASLSTRFDGKPAAYINVSRIGEQDTLKIANAVKKYVNDKEAELPEKVSFALWTDNSKILRQRIGLLSRNAYIGLILVFLCLTVFTNLRLAFWTTLGIPISFLGAFWVMPMFDVSINMISLFAFIMSLGIVVDDAIVVGENIFTYRSQGMSRVDASIKGVKEMAMPVVLAVLTTNFAFLPLAYTTGIMGKILRVLPVVVISVLSFSLIEALLILPAHLSGKRIVKDNFITRFTERLNRWTATRLERFINGRFAELVKRAVKWRYVTLATGITIFLITVGLVIGGYIGFSFFDPVEADNILAILTMPQGTPFKQTQEIIAQIEQAGLQVVQEVDAKRPGQPSIIKHIAVTVGDTPTSNQNQGPGSAQRASRAVSHLGEVNIELLSAEERGNVSAREMKDRWRQVVGEIPGVSSLRFFSELASAGEPINIELSHDDFAVLLPAVEELKASYRQYTGVKDISDSFEPGKTEMKLELTDVGRSSGLTLGYLAKQVRQGFYGEEVQRIQRGRDDIRLMVRYPQSERRSLGDVENMRIRLPDGTELPFQTVARVNYGVGYSTIKRVDRWRAINVTADVDAAVANSKIVNDSLARDVLPELMQKYPGLTYRYAGQVRERNESLGSLRVNFLIAMLAIYGLLAIQFKSYAQPLIVMSAIPFGVVGAVWGHVIMSFVFMTKFNLSILSMFGIVALSGVVVNDSLIMIDLINRERTSGIKLTQVLRDCATRRFRPIMLTTLTTFFGLAPMLLERSIQARFLIPMAISLAFGVMFATLITLFLVPSLYMILEDIKKRLKKFLPGE